MNTQHPRSQLEPALTNPLRFSLLAALAGVEEMTFAQMRDFLLVSDSTLSKHASALESHGLVKIKKAFVGKKPQTTLRISPQGLKTWKSHLAALQAIADTARPSKDDVDSPDRAAATKTP
ncbi:helix-turn-helix domain-containing protein [Corynebacterium canis]|uniref:Helix-turn-helix domain-containing protein n=1 Tax=Corynebacterium canis TaxID=679663 RepID=A0A5C5UBG2_9CORY|nr:transcriptional regulator [Corynebacterium canis]TWT22925.1 helix-turn-helix domain-containing protein [Corynebacterium canis]WJY74696.1 Helix-turn-helix domain protein [Corynebacterium canis]